MSFRVYYEDTDAQGVVYYANYFKFMERGRTEFLAATGKPVQVWQDEGRLMVVHSLQAKFRRPARLGDVIDVISDYSLASPYRGRFVQRVERDGELLVEATVEMACTDRQGGLMEMPHLESR